MIRVRRNSSGRSRGCIPRKLVAVEYLQDPEAWKHRHLYGQRWMAKAVFSTLKRLFGEHVSTRKRENMARELIVKASLYNLFIGLTATP